MDRIRTPDPAAEETGKIVSHRGDREVTSPGLTRTQVSPFTTASTSNSKTPPERSCSGSPVVPLEQPVWEIDKPILCRSLLTLTRPKPSRTSPIQREVGVSWASGSDTCLDNNDSECPAGLDTVKANNSLGLGLDRVKGNDSLALGAMPAYVPFHQRHNYGNVRYDSGLRQFVHVPEEEIFESVCKDGIIDENPGFDGGMTIPKLNNDQTTQLDAIRNIEQEAAKRRFEPEGKSLRKKKSYNVNPEDMNNEQKHQASNSPKLEEGDTCTSPRKLRRKTETPQPPILFDKKRAEMRVQSRLTRDSKVIQDTQKGGMESYRRGNDRHLNKLQCGYESPKPMPQTPLNDNLRQKGTKIRKDRVRNNRQNGTE